MIFFTTGYFGSEEIAPAGRFPQARPLPLPSLRSGRGLQLVLISAGVAVYSISGQGKLQLKAGKMRLKPASRVSSIKPVNRKGKGTT
ncbi:hypothetical protein [Planococcus lenghuensis]|uniref:Uncharacterized protein n=1 Tax=Planococcus lenghuensis TaxID=2213202 RepID=A0A1Q2L098_9BACL|nr:hypothetical protein [Planococcus lenghuensis]AQQ53880.1 hypothetical protein B0X71_12790 [Planococcus lenghuensis]